MWEYQKQCLAISRIPWGAKQFTDSVSPALEPVTFDPISAAESQRWTKIYCFIMSRLCSGFVHRSPRESFEADFELVEGQKIFSTSFAEKFRSDEKWKYIFKIQTNRDSVTSLIFKNDIFLAWDFIGCLCLFDLRKYRRTIFFILKM